MDPVIMIVFVLFASVTFWVHSLVKKLDQRLRSLEKQHLALVAEIESRLYDD
jgi:hypothetical protein